MYSNEQIESILTTKRTQRNAMIDSLVLTNDIKDRTFCMVLYDETQAPLTTDRARLAEFGIDIPDKYTEYSAELLEDILRGYEYLGTKFINHEHLTEEELLEFILDHLLSDSVRDVPPDTTHTEYIDLALVKTTTC